MNKGGGIFADNDPQALLHDGIQAYQDGNLAEADATFRRVLKLDKNHADANH